MIAQLNLNNGSVHINVPALLLPSVVRYHDDYSNKQYSFSEFELNVWPIHANGSVSNIKFEPFSESVQLLKIIKAYACDLIRTVSGTTAYNYIQGLSLIATKEIIGLLTCEVNRCRRLWDIMLAQQMYAYSYQALKSLLKYSASHKIGSWSPRYISFISSSLPLPSRDKHAAVRSGDVFIDTRTEAKIVRWIYDAARSASSLSVPHLVDAGLVVCNYQFAMRPKQIGILRQRDMRVYKSQTGDVSVHLTFHMLKQRTAMAKRCPLIRKIKREWVPIFTELLARTQSSSDAYLFGITNTVSLTSRLKAAIVRITGEDWTPTDLRHSGAMRQVDAGASAEELAEFMGHSSLDSGIVYYDTSATQAERVNAALGISQTYKTVARIANLSLISPHDLAVLKGENQIAGVPHGIPISGIGACKTGQPSCPYNPITACYGCPRFIATSDPAIHKKVLSDFREIVHFYYSASRGENQSPAYLQLRQTISEVQSVITHIESEDAQFR